MFQWNLFIVQRFSASYLPRFSTYLTIQISGRSTVLYGLQFTYRLLPYTKLNHLLFPYQKNIVTLMYEVNLNFVRSHFRLLSTINPYAAKSYGLASIMF